MPHDHLVRKQALRDYKKWILHSQIKTLYLFLDKNGHGNNVLITIEVENKPS